jgi:hypothetical protein
LPRIDHEALHGRWMHSHEEDAGEEMVFRPAGHPFPPARGRSGFELRPDGSAVESFPGPTDVPEQRPARWSLEGDRLRIAGGDEALPTTWQVTGLEAGRLTLRRLE